MRSLRCKYEGIISVPGGQAQGVRLHQRFRYKTVVCIIKFRIQQTGAIYKYRRRLYPGTSHRSGTCLTSLPIQIHGRHLIPTSLPPVALLRASPCQVRSLGRAIMVKIDLTRIRCDCRPINDAPPQAQKQASHWTLYYTTMVTEGSRSSRSLALMRSLAIVSFLILS